MMYSPGARPSSERRTVRSKVSSAFTSKGSVWVMATGVAMLLLSMSLMRRRGSAMWATPVNLNSMVESMSYSRVWVFKNRKFSIRMVTPRFLGLGASDRSCRRLRSPEPP